VFQIKNLAAPTAPPPNKKEECFKFPLGGDVFGAGLTLHQMDV